MCSTAASIEDKKNLHKNETCLDHSNNHHTPHMDKFTILVFAINFDLKTIWTIEF